MHEQENIALIQKIYSAFSAEDVQTILNHVSATAEWVNYGPEMVPYAGNFTGRIAEFFQAIGPSTKGGKVIADKFVAQADSVISIGRYTATVRKTGANIDTPVAHIHGPRRQSGELDRVFRQRGRCRGAHRHRSVSSPLKGTDKAWS